MYETFIKKVEEALGGPPSLFDTNGGYQWGNKGEPGVWIKWSTGGQGGASCWDEGPAQYYATEGSPQPEFEELDKILEVVCPNIGFLQYKRICREVVKDQRYSDSDYYGNYDNYAIKYVMMKDLYNALNSRNLGDW